MWRTQDSSLTLDASRNLLFLNSPEFNFSAVLVNSWLLCLLLVEISNYVMLNLNYLYVSLNTRPL